MIKEISIENYKSIQKLDLNLGRITVLIGANGSGKSNILEAIALSAAAANNTLDNGFLTARGIRVTDDPRLMRSAFEPETAVKDIRINFKSGNEVASDYLLKNDDNQPYSQWTNTYEVYRDIGESIEGIITALDSKNEYEQYIPQIEDSIGKVLAKLAEMAPETDLRHEGQPNDRKVLSARARALYHKFGGPEELRDFIIYSPEYTMLRTFEEEGQIQPIGIRGEGLFKLLKIMSENKSESPLRELKDKLTFIDWFSDFEVPGNLSTGERTLRIKDRYLHNELAYFNQKSTNEGFLFLLFYFTLFISDLTPSFFAVDNIDASLNPKLCSQLMEELAGLAAKNDKQVILTTHNPAILDGLNLNDDEQRLFVVSRNRSGHTHVKRILAPQSSNGEAPVRLSEAFLRGYIGGLPKNF